MIHYVSGDIFASANEIEAFAHGCNCIGGMDAGIAVYFKKKWPDMFTEYKKLCTSGKFTLGNFFLWEESGQYIFNLATQETWWTPATVDSVSLSLNNMLKEALKVGLSYIVLPKIGAGFGKMRWTTVKALIEDTACLHSVDLVVCDNFIQGLGLSNWES